MRRCQRNPKTKHFSVKIVISRLNVGKVKMKYSYNLIMILSYSWHFHFAGYFLYFCSFCSCAFRMQYHHMQFPN